MASLLAPHSPSPESAVPSSHREPAFIAPEATFHSFSPIHSGLVLGSRVSQERAWEAVSADEARDLPLDDVEAGFFSLDSDPERLDRRFCFPPLSLSLSFSFPVSLPLLRSADADEASAEGLDRLDLPLDSEASASVVRVFFVVRELFSGLVVCSPSSCLLCDDRLRRSVSFPSLVGSADGVVDRASADGASEAFSAVSTGVDVSRGFFVLLSTSLPLSSPPAAELAEPEPEPEPTSLSLFGLRLLLCFSFVSARLRESIASLVSPSVDGEELERREPDPVSLPLSLVVAATSAFAFCSARARRRASLSSSLSATSVLASLPADEDEDDLLLDGELFVLASVPDVEVRLEERVFVTLDVGGVVLVRSFPVIGAVDEEPVFLSRSRSLLSRDDGR
jgi:hypothetical protein